MPLIEVTLAEGRSPNRSAMMHEVHERCWHGRHPARTHPRHRAEVPRTHWATGDLTLREMDAGKANPGDKEKS